LPGRYGIGDLGAEARQFADWLASAGQTWWQMLPLGPTGYGESPYQLFSAFAGNPMLLSLDRMVESGYLSARDLAGQPRFSDDSVEFECVMPWKNTLLRRAFEGAKTRAEPTEPPWLGAFAEFMALKEANGGKSWTEWD